MIQFSRAESLELTLASFGHLEELYFRNRGAGAAGQRGPPGRSPFPSFVSSVLGDSVASQSRHSLPTVTGLTVASKTEASIYSNNC